MSSGIYYSDLMDLENRGNALNGAAIAFSLIGGAAVVAGAGWLGYWLTHRQRPAAVSLTPASAASPAATY
jgi:hypothetical protein